MKCLLLSFLTKLLFSFLSNFNKLYKNLNLYNLGCLCYHFKVLRKCEWFSGAKFQGENEKNICQFRFFCDIIPYINRVAQTDFLTV